MSRLPLRCSSYLPRAVTWICHGAAARPRGSDRNCGVRPTFATATLGKAVANRRVRISAVTPSVVRRMTPALGSDPSTRAPRRPADPAKDASAGAVAVLRRATSMSGRA